MRPTMSPAHLTLCSAALGLSALTLATLSGCVALVAGAVAGAGAYAYAEGKLESTLNAPLDRSYAAARRAISDLEFTETSAKKDALEAVVEARTAGNDTVTITLKALAVEGGDPSKSTTTKCSIRIGTFGDEKKSITILDAIKSRL
ncbi:MAG: DUF3568 family protein [Phycisphaerales bacterium]